MWILEEEKTENVFYKWINLSEERKFLLKWPEGIEIQEEAFNSLASGIISGAALQEQPL